jgi:hypothetical protein
MDTIYKSDKYEDNWYLQVSVDEDGYGILEDVYNAGDVYEKRYNELQHNKKATERVWI